MNRHHRATAIVMPKEMVAPFGSDEVESEFLQSFNEARA